MCACRVVYLPSPKLRSHMCKTCPKVPSNIRIPERTVYDEGYYSTQTVAEKLEIACNYMQIF